MSLLPELSSLAGLILAFNVAYLKLDQFRYQERVREYARVKLKEIAESREVTSRASQSESYNALTNLAEDPPGRIRDLERFWSKVYAVFLRTRLDRVLSFSLAMTGFAAVCVGNAHAVNHWQALAPFFSSGRISWSLWILVVCAGLSALLALFGDQIVRGTCKNIDKYALEPMNLMMDKATTVKVNKDAS